MDISNFLDDDFSALAKLSIAQSKPTAEHVDQKTNPPADPVLDYVQKVKYHWLYSARSGYWWHYDKEANEDLENAQLMGLSEAKLTVAGGTQVVANLTTMMQGQRQIRRVTYLGSVKLRGVAGKYYNEDIINPSTNNESRKTDPVPPETSSCHVTDI